jgi:hydrogenase expression/formation protein HypC
MTPTWPDVAPAAQCDPHGGCITCGDVALPMIVRRIDPERGLALCEDADGRRESVEIALVDPVAVGDRLLVHAGTAIGRASGDEVGCGGEPSRGRDVPAATRERGETD